MTCFPWVPNHFVRLFALLSKAVFMLSRDSVTLEEVDDAERCLERFSEDFQTIFGPGKMRFNVHVLLHVLRAVRMWGPLQFHSTFFFESLNGRLKKYIRSPKGAADQIVNCHLMLSLVNSFAFHPALDEEVRDELDFILSGLQFDGSYPDHRYFHTPFRSIAIAVDVFEAKLLQTVVSNHRYCRARLEPK